MQLAGSSTAWCIQLVLHASSLLLVHSESIVLQHICMYAGSTVIRNQTGEMLCCSLTSGMVQDGTLFVTWQLARYQQLHWWIISSAGFDLVFGICIWLQANLDTMWHDNEVKALGGVGSFEKTTIMWQSCFISHYLGIV